MTNCPSKPTAYAFQHQLLTWFDQHGRHNLPWQNPITPYRVWISEIMLQQTQVTTVIPYFERFMATYPTVEQLARASIDHVLHLWTGLGYYARARNIHRTAERIVNDYDGSFPTTLDEMMTLPGIGRSTAGAILAIASHQPHPILDGNVKRVLARVHAVEGWPGTTDVAKQLWHLAEQYTPITRVADYTQAIMDLGAMICTRSAPRCGECPFVADCQAHATDATHRYPGKKPRKDKPIKSVGFLIVQHPSAGILLQLRSQQGIWGGLWGLPEFTAEPKLEHAAKQHAQNMGIESNQIRHLSPLNAFRHTFSHYHLDIHPILLTLTENTAQHHAEPDTMWYNNNEHRVGLAAPVKKLLEQLTQEDTQ